MNILSPFNLDKLMLLEAEGTGGGGGDATGGLTGTENPEPEKKETPEQKDEGNKGDAGKGGKEPDKGKDKEPAKEDDGVNKDDPYKPTKVEIKAGESPAYDFLTKSESEHGSMGAIKEAITEGGMTAAEVEAIFGEAVKSNDADKIDRAALEKKLGKVQAGLIMASINTFVEHRKSVREKLDNSVYEAVGGQKTWDSIVAWANKSISKEEAAEIGKLLRGSEHTRKLAARDLKARFLAANGGSTGKRETGDGQVAPDLMTKEKFNEAMKALKKKASRGIDTRAEHAALVEKRRAVIRQELASGKR